MITKTTLSTIFSGFLLLVKPIYAQQQGLDDVDSLLETLVTDFSLKSAGVEGSNGGGNGGWEDYNEVNDKYYGAWEPSSKSSKAKSWVCSWHDSVLEAGSDSYVAKASKNGLGGPAKSSKSGSKSGKSEPTTTTSTTAAATTAATTTA